MISRRDFLSGVLSRRKTTAPIRPPWALTESDFLSACTGCGDCTRACPTGIIVEVDKRPQLDFAKGECTFCADCVHACQHGALQRPEGDIEGRPWHIVADISGQCLAHANIVCRSCGDACVSSAIRFQPRMGAAALPEVDAEKCTGCGACVAACPQTAIRMR